MFIGSDMWAAWKVNFSPILFFPYFPLYVKQVWDFRNPKPHLSNAAVMQIFNAGWEILIV